MTGTLEYYYPPFATEKLPIKLFKRSTAVQKMTKGLGVACLCLIPGKH